MKRKVDNKCGSDPTDMASQLHVCIGLPEIKIAPKTGLLSKSPF